jgi:transglutaminase-like putative cysteine protease
VAEVPKGVKTYTIDAGDRGALRTLQVMKQIVNESLIDPYVIGTAKTVVSEVWGKDEIGQVKAIRRWVLEHTRFCRDPRGVELLHTPKWLLKTIELNYYAMIDCDDMAILTAALAKSIGLAARWIVLGFHDPKGPFTHVYTELGTPKGWMAVDLRDQYETPIKNVSRKGAYPVDGAESGIGWLQSLLKGGH